MKDRIQKSAPYAVASLLLTCVHIDAFAGCEKWIRPGMSLVINDASLPAGDVEVCIERANYDGQLDIQGVRGRKVKFTSEYADSSLWASFRGGVLIRNSSNITLTKINVSRPIVDPLSDPAAILIDQGSENNVIDEVHVHDSSHGIAIGGAVYQGQGGPAGAGNIIQNSQVEKIRLNGITVGKGSATVVNASHKTNPFGTFISRNKVNDTGGHGIDVDESKGVRIVNNIVSNAGSTKTVAPGGYSGIHLYSSKDNGSCSSSQVFYNYVWGTKSIPGVEGTDGNGIQLDNFCDDNAVGYNVVWNNAGAGIAIFNAARNEVYSNTVAFNSQQEGRTATFDPKSSGVGEIVLSACIDRRTEKNQCAEFRPHDGRTNNNNVYDNIVFSSIQRAPGINVHETAVKNELKPGEDLRNKVGPNMISTAGAVGDAAWPLLVYGQNSSFFTNEAVDQATSTSGNLIEIPSVVGYDPNNLASVYTGNSFQLTRLPSKIGKKFPERALWIDILGQHSNDISSVFFGAYYNLKK